MMFVRYVRLDVKCSGIFDVDVGVMSDGWTDNETTMTSLC